MIIYLGIKYTYQSFLKQEKCLTALWTGLIYEKSVQNSILVAQAFSFRYLTKKVSVVSLIQACLLVFIYVSTKYYQNISNHLEVMKCTRIWLRKSSGGVNLKKYPSKWQISRPHSKWLSFFNLGHQRYNFIKGYTCLTLQWMITPQL